MFSNAIYYHSKNYNQVYLNIIKSKLDMLFYYHENNPYLNPKFYFMFGSNECQCLMPDLIQKVPKPKSLFFYSKTYAVIYSNLVQIQFYYYHQ